MALALTRTHTDAVITALQGLGLTVGDGEAPAGTPPYVVVYPIAGGGTSGVLAAPDDDAELVIQVTCVGQTRQQTEWLQDKALTMLTTEPTVANRSIPRVSLDSFGGIFRDDTAEPPTWSATPRFRLYSTPA